jgi:hypothetical protein
MRLDAARRFALSLPETTEEPHFEKSSFRVKGKIFATVPEGGKLLHVFVDADEGAALVEEDPAAYEHIAWGKKERTDWLRVHLAKAKTDQVEELLEAAWRAKAPPKVRAAFDAG